MRTTTSALGVLLIACGSAAAQNTLDKPLDKNLQVGSGGARNPPRPDLVRELALRNALVTGNAPGGFSFRGDVGYRAPGEFFGDLGSNDSFSYRRDSYYSGLGGLGIRGTDALQYQFAMTTGNTPPPGFAGAPSLNRSGTSFTAEAIRTRENNAVGTESGITRATVNPTEPGADVRGMSLLSLRSPAAFMASRGLEPTMIGRMPTADGGMVGVSASPLRGITYDSTPAPVKEPDKPRPGSVPPISERLDDGAGLAGAPDAKSETKLDMSANTQRSAYDDLMDRIKGGGDKAQNADPAKDPGKAVATQSWQEQLEELRKQLRTADGAPAPKRPGETDKPGTPRPADAVPGEGGGKTEPSGGAIDRIRNAGAKVDTLAPRGFDAYSVHMQAAQEHIAASRFFFAEERFTAALAIKSGDPMAAIGRIHSQMGAGMFLSAAINLRSLFAEHPELVSLKYKPELLPSRERVQSIVERLTGLTSVRDDKRRDSALLLAYLGFQSGDARAMKQGLDIMAQAPEAGPGEKPAEGPDQLQKLASLLSAIWLSPSAPQRPTPTAPEPGK